MAKFYKHIFLLLLIGSVIVPSAFSQHKKLIVFKGLMVDKNTSEPIPFSHIVNIDRKRGTISSENGTFALYVRPYDTLMLSSVGFLTKIIVIDIPEDSMRQRVIIELVKDTIQLADIIIYGKSWEHFKKEFIELDIDSDAYTKAVIKAEQWFNEGLKSRKPKVGISMPGPISLLYEYFNNKEVLKRRLRKNREKYGYVVPDDIL